MIVSMDAHFDMYNLINLSLKSLYNCLIVYWCGSILFKLFLYR